MIIAVDTGGTKTLVAGSDSEGRFHTRHRFATPKDDENLYIDLLAQTISEHFDMKKVKAISIAVPGFTRGDVFVQCLSPALNWPKNFELGKKLKEKLGVKIPIFLENDANLAGLAEAHAFEKIPQSCLYITVSTGIGTGATRNGQLVEALDYFEGGKAVLEYDGLLRVWEDFASGRSIYETYGRYARDIKSRAVWEQIAEKISRGIIVFAPTINPDVIVIGGSIGTYFDKYQAPLNAYLEKHIPNIMATTTVVQAKHHEEAVIYGCKIYAEQKLT